MRNNTLAKYVAGARRVCFLIIQVEVLPSLTLKRLFGGGGVEYDKIEEGSIKFLITAVFYLRLEHLVVELPNDAKFVCAVTIVFAGLQVFHRKEGKRLGGGVEVDALMVGSCFTVIMPLRGVLC